MKVRKEKFIPLPRVGERYQVTIPKEARQAIGLKAGDLVEARPGRGCIILYPKTVIDRVDVDKRLAEAEADVKAGRVHGPFASVPALVKSLRGAQPTKKKKA
jgi:AbrB family looped-hinge helix DNA binding protein